MNPMTGKRWFVAVLGLSVLALFALALSSSSAVLAQGGPALGVMPPKPNLTAMEAADTISDTLTMPAGVGEVQRSLGDEDRTVVVPNNPVQESKPVPPTLPNVVKTSPNDDASVAVAKPVQNTERSFVETLWQIVVAP